MSSSAALHFIVMFQPSFIHLITYLLLTFSEITFLSSNDVNFQITQITYSLNKHAEDRLRVKDRTLIVHCTDQIAFEIQQQKE